MFKDRSSKNRIIPFWHRTIKNPDRKWYQLWLPRRVPNPDYMERLNDDQIKIDIVRGNS